MYVGWGFAAFVFYKVCTALVYDEGMNLSAALVGGIVAGVMIYLQGQYVAVQIRWGAGLGRHAMAVVLSGAIMSGLLWLIVQGFDADFAHRVAWPDDGYSPGLAHYAREQKNRVLVFLVVGAAPLLAKGIATLALLRSIYGSK